MLADLRFVQGAVARKDYEPSLTHFCIKDGRILGYNGAIALCTPTDLPISCVPKAVPFVKAVATCREAIELHMTENGRLCIRSAGFKAFVECLEDGEYPDVQPEGTVVDIPDGGILPALQQLTPFIGQDASRPWARGVLLRGHSAFATNNIIAVQKWLGYRFPVDINIAEEAVEEILRIGEEPRQIQVGENSATFHFGGGRWLRCQLLSTEWPDVERIFDRPSDPKPLPEGFFDGLHSLTAFTDDLDHVYLLDGVLSTAAADGTGASVRVEGVPAGGVYNVRQLLHLEGIVRTIDLAAFPEPCMWFGEKLRGAIVGMRL